MTVYFVISLPRMPYITRIFMVLANPIYEYFMYKVAKFAILVRGRRVGTLSFIYFGWQRR